MWAISLFLFVLSVAASFIQRVSGFGFGIFVMMFFPFFIPTFGEATTLSGLLAGTTSLIIAVKNRKYIRWKTITVLFIANVITAYLAIEYMSGLSNATLKKSLGVALILISLYFLFFQGKHPLPTTSKSVQVLMGSLSGITGGMFAMPGPPIVLYCIHAFRNKKEYIASLQTLFCASNIFYTLFRVRVGFFTEQTLYYWGIGLIGLFLGTQLGARCFEHISGATLKKIVYLLMMVSGIVCCLKS